MLTLAIIDDVGILIGQASVNASPARLRGLGSARGQIDQLSLGLQASDMCCIFVVSYKSKLGSSHSRVLARGGIRAVGAENSLSLTGGGLEE